MGNISIISIGLKMSFRLSRHRDFSPRITQQLLHLSYPSLVEIKPLHSVSQEEPKMTTKILEMSVWRQPIIKRVINVDRVVVASGFTTREFMHFMSPSVNCTLVKTMSCASMWDRPQTSIDGL